LQIVCNKDFEHNEEHMPEWRHEHANLMEDAAGLLRTRGGRMTAQRRLILKVYREASEHPTAEEIHKIARRKDPGLNLSTVYRTMRWLEQEGLVRARRLDADSRSERFDSARPDEHHHFVCSECRRIVEFDGSELEPVLRSLEKRYRLRIDQSTLVLHGLCDQCRPGRSIHHTKADVTLEQ
jgi:Fe2+ or Zn2+ uptake regulation protein